MAKFRKLGDLRGNPQLAAQWDADIVLSEMYESGWVVRVVNTREEANKLRAMIRGAGRRHAVGGITTYVTEVPAQFFEESHSFNAERYHMESIPAPECDGRSRYLVEANTLDHDGGWGYPPTRRLFHEMTDRLCDFGMS